MYNLTVLPQIVPFIFGEDSVNSGDSVSATCSVIKGDLPITFQWLFSGSPIIGDKSVQFTQVSKRISTLSIELVDAKHSGLYTCKAQNNAGSSNYSVYLNVNGIFY